MTDRDLAIRTRELTRRFGSLTAVDHIDLQIRPGTIFGFLGPNGSGKTTAIRMLAGLLSPSEGEIEVLGLSVPRQAERLKTHIGYMTQRFSLYGDLSVRENLEFIAAIHALPRNETRHRIEEAESEYDLNQQSRQRADTLSGGQRQRLALAAATLHRPELLFLDEPTSAVDPQSRRAFWDKLFELSEQGRTILVSTHYMDEAERCHELAILDRGAVAARGEPNAMRDDIKAHIVRVRADHPRRAAEHLQSSKEVLGVTQIGNALRVQISRDVDDPAGFVEKALSDSVTLADCRQVPASLEDVFVAATNRKGRPS